jgi:hypothetical protein
MSAAIEAKLFRAPIEKRTIATPTSAKGAVAMELPAPLPFDQRPPEPARDRVTGMS